MDTLKDFKTQLHTIFILIGPSNCGKSHFATKTLIPSLSNILKQNNIVPNVQYISSDEIRRQLNGNLTLDKYDSIMLESSSQAFATLYNYLDSVTQFPINCHFAVLDTTGLTKEFRDRVISISKKNNYNVEAIIFNYNDHKSYYAYGGDSRVIESHIKKLRKNTLKELGRDYTQKHYIKSQEYAFNYHITDVLEYAKCILDDKKYYIIGDVHECIDEVKKLIINMGFEIENDVIKDNSYGLIFVGDLIDKGDKLRETVDFFHKNMNTIKIVRGNHDYAVMKLINGLQKEDENTDKYYSSYKIFKNDLELSNKFLEIEARMYPFLKFTPNGSISQEVGANESKRFGGSKGKSFFVTHAPCDEKYVGKLSKESIKMQKYMCLDRKNNQKLKDIIHINEESYNSPFIVSGHFSLRDIYNGSKGYANNRLFIDTGCIHGNKLSAILLGKNIERPKIFQIPFMGLQNIYQRELENFGDKIVCDETTKTLFGNLESSQVSRIKYLVKNKINFISGTISPSPSDGIGLESFKKGLEYYHDHFNKHNIKMKLSIQPKYMGSRCNIYLFQDINSCYSTSRNGYLIQQVDNTIMKAQYEKLLEKFNDFMNKNKIKMMIIDSELMPWRAIGGKLIDKTFGVIDYALNKELDVLKSYGFEKMYDDVVSKFESSNFKQDMKNNSNKKTHDQYGGALYQSYKELMYENQKHIKIEDLEKGAKIYSDQIGIYGSDGDIEFKPFSVLKIVFSDDTEMIPGLSDKILEMNGQVNIFNFVSNDNQFVVDFENGFEKCLEDAEKFYKNVTTNAKMEGIIIKPDQPIFNIAPCIKVRNSDYLTIIYGYDYTTKYKYSKLIKNKNIGKKINASISEFKIGHEMLQTKYNEISLDNNNYIKLLVDFLFVENNEKLIDPRL